jgi:excisionase family DNA binding protein
MSFTDAAPALAELLTIRQVSKEGQWSEQHTRNLIRRKQLSAIRIGGRNWRVRRSALEAFMARGVNLVVAGRDRKSIAAGDND